MLPAPGILIIQPLMLMSHSKQETITFKVDSELATILARLPNRSEFIRKALLSAIENTCPVCQGTGQLDAHQKEHWETLVEEHHLEHCEKCGAIHEQVDVCVCTHSS